MIKDNIVIKIPPRRLTAHNGILSKKPQSDIASITSWGNTVSVAIDKPTVIICSSLISLFVRYSLNKSNKRTNLPTLLNPHD